MNEIDPKTNKGQPVDPPGKGTPIRKRTSTGDDAFRNLLNERISPSSVRSDENKSAGLPELSATFKASLLNLESTRTDFVQQLNTSFKLLESYAAWLGDPEKSLKQTRSLLDQLLAQADSLDMAFNSLPSTPSDLADILSRLKTTVQVELIKFDRGDYL